MAARDYAVLIEPLPEPRSAGVVAKRWVELE
jgi:hypothetical protein